MRFFHGKETNMYHGFKSILIAVVLTIVFIPPAYPDDGSTTKQFTVYPIGTIKKDGEKTTVVLDEKYQPGLLGLEDYSHLYVLV